MRTGRDKRPVMSEQEERKQQDLSCVYFSLGNMTNTQPVFTFIMHTSLNTFTNCKNTQKSSNTNQTKGNKCKCHSIF